MIKPCKHQKFFYNFVVGYKLLFKEKNLNGCRNTKISLRFERVISFTCPTNRNQFRFGQIMGTLSLNISEFSQCDTE